jgi:coproporphyrinogen III oxidase-like Fe-S oxidoreductase
MAAINRGTLPSQRGVQMDQDDSIRADVIQQIMCHGLVDIEALQARYDMVFQDYFAPELKRICTLRDDGLVEMTHPAGTCTASAATQSEAGALLSRGGRDLRCGPRKCAGVESAQKLGGLSRQVSRSFGA